MLFPDLVQAQGFNIDSSYKINDQDAVSGDIIIIDSEKGLVRTNLANDSRIFGVIEDKPVPKIGFFFRALIARGHSIFSLIEVDLSSRTGIGVGVGVGKLKSCA